MHYYLYYSSYLYILLIITPLRYTVWYILLRSDIIILGHKPHLLVNPYKYPITRLLDRLKRPWSRFPSFYSSVRRRQATRNRFLTFAPTHTSNHATPKSPQPQQQPHHYFTLQSLQTCLAFTTLDTTSDHTNNQVTTSISPPAATNFDRH